MIYVKQIILQSVIFLRLSFYSFTFYSFTDYEGCALRATYSNQCVRTRRFVQSISRLKLAQPRSYCFKTKGINICVKLGEGCALTLTKFIGLRSRS